MISGVRRLAWKKKKIFRGIISFISINMVDYFSGAQRSTKHPLHHRPVLMLSFSLCIANTFSGTKSGLTQLSSSIGGHSLTIMGFVILCEMLMLCISIRIKRLSMKLISAVQAAKFMLSSYTAQVPVKGFAAIITN